VVEAVDTVRSLKRFGKESFLSESAKYFELHGIHLKIPKGNRNYYLIESL